MKYPRPIEHERKKMRRELGVAFSAALIIGLIFLVESALAPTAVEIPFSGHLLLFGLLSVVILLLILIIFFLIRNFFKLIFERRGKLLGSHLKTRLTLAFVALTLVPTVVLFIASAGVLNTTIESWFKSQVEESLQSALVVEQAFYQNASEKALNAGNHLASTIVSGGLLEPAKMNDLIRIMGTTRINEGVSSFQIYLHDNSPPVASNDPALKDIAIPQPAPSFLKIAFQGDKTAKITPLDDGSYLISGIVPIPDSTRGKVVGALVSNYFIPASFAGRLSAVSSAFRDYQESRRMRGPVKTVNVLILLMVALLVILIGFWFGMTMARDITDPILNLAEGTDKVAAGNLDVYIEPVGDDELGVLVRSFNKMASDLRRNRDELIRVNTDLDSRRKYMETVLKSVAAGVLSIDPEGRITTINNSAIRLLGITAKDPVNKPLTDVAPEAALAALLEIIDEVRSSSETFQRQITISFPEKVVSILCFASFLRDDEAGDLGAVLVFEDMTHLIKAQRMAAWREVARRIAHEIKNPLTPIKLNAQRLRRKYINVLGKDSEVLDLCTRAIVDQVDQLKNMVNEFSKFARMPAANPAPNDLNLIISETMGLYSQCNDKMKFDFIPDSSVPIFDLDREQITRALVNLLDNAVAATGSEGEVNISTAYDKALSIASVEISDNGIGVDSGDREKLFEPYFTRKSGGTGLGLTIVSTIISDHNGFIRVKDNHGKRGTTFVLELPVRKRSKRHA